MRSSSANWITRAFGRRGAGRPDPVRTRLRLESVEGRIVPSTTLPDPPSGGEAVTAAPDPTPTDAGTPPGPDDHLQPTPNEERIRELERQLGQLQGRKAELETSIQGEERGIRELQEILDRTGNPDIRTSLELARGRLDIYRQELQGVTDEITGIRQQIERLRRGLTDEPTTPPPSDGTPDSDADASVAPPALPTSDEGGQP